MYCKVPQSNENNSSGLNHFNNKSLSMKQDDFHHSTLDEVNIYESNEITASIDLNELYATVQKADLEIMSDRNDESSSTNKANPFKELYATVNKN